MNNKNITIDGHTRLCGLIGNPVEHTSSPAIHNTLASIYGHNLVYVPFLVENGRISEAVKGGYALNVLGMNVTVPYKSDVFDSLVEIDELAKRIGAVNTLVRTEGGYKGYNTDILGLERALKVAGAEIEGEAVVILGAGGAARSAAFLCEKLGAKKIYILNRSIEKAEAVADEVNAYVEKKGSDTDEERLAIAYSIKDYKLIAETRFTVLQATSVGLSPNDEDVVIDEADFYDRVSFGFDLIYRPAETKFMKLVKAHGGKTSNGLAMLLYQGIIAYELWMGISISEEVAKEVYSVLEGTVRA